MNKRHYVEIDKLRGIAILMVLMYHAVIVYPVNLHEITWCRLLHEFLWYMEMPLFFMVSGFCYSYRRGEYGAYLCKRGKRLLVPHVAFGLMEILPRIIPNPLVREQTDAGGALRDFLLYGGGDWFLWTLFLISLAFPLVDRLYQAGVAGKAAIIGGAILLYLFSPGMTNVLLLQMCAWFLLYFVAGYAVRQAGYGAWREKAAALPRAAAAVGLCGLAVMLAVFAWNMSSPGGEARLLTPIGALAGAAALWLAAEKCGGFAGRFLEQCGAYSLQMYLLGAYALVASRTILTMVMGIRLPAVIILGNFVIDTALTLFISRFVLKRFKVLRFMSGLG